MRRFRTIDWHQGSPELVGGAALSLVLTVHDEIVVECPKELSSDVERILKEAMREGMEQFVQGIPIEIDTRISLCLE